MISTAGDATLSVADPSSTATGHLVNGTFALPQPLQAKAAQRGRRRRRRTRRRRRRPRRLHLLGYAGPVTNDAVTIAFKQSIDATDALRTGSYSKTLTFTLSTTTAVTSARARRPRGSRPARPV